MKTLTFKLDEGADMPYKSHAADAGFDLVAKQVVFDGEKYTISTGVHVAIPCGFVGLILPRSSISNKGIHITTGVIDSGYTGEIRIVAYSLTGRLIFLNPSDRVAQLVVMPIFTGKVIQALELDETERGNGGFGSTGV